MCYVCPSLAHLTWPPGQRCRALALAQQATICPRTQSHLVRFSLYPTYARSCLIMTISDKLTRPLCQDLQNQQRDRESKTPHDATAQPEPRGTRCPWPWAEEQLSKNTTFYPTLCPRTPDPGLHKSQRFSNRSHPPQCRDKYPTSNTPSSHHTVPCLHPPPRCAS